LAEAATSNEIRSHHYAIANRYLLLAEAELKAVQVDERRGSRVSATRTGYRIGAKPHGVGPSAEAP
jgi:hypothetical protein